MPGPHTTAHSPEIYLCQLQCWRSHSLDELYFSRGEHSQCEAGNLDAADHGASTQVQSAGQASGMVCQSHPTNHGTGVEPVTSARHSNSKGMLE